MTTALRPASPEAVAAAQRRAAAVAARFGVRSIDRATLAVWQGESDRRTTYLLDVRTPDEFAAGHLPDSVSTPGGQLVQAIDRGVAPPGARLVLLPDVDIPPLMTPPSLMPLRCAPLTLDH